VNAANPRDLSALRGGLTGLRPPPAAAAPSPIPAQPDPAPDHAPGDRPAREDRPRPRRRTPKVAAPSASTSGKRPVQVYLAATTKEAMERAANGAGVTLTEWLLDTFDRLDGELQDHFAPPAPRRSSLPPRTRVVRARSEASSSVQLRLTDEELEVLDGRAEELGVPSRSAFLARVVELGLSAD